MPNLKKGPDRKSRCSLVNVKVRARCCISAHSFKTRYVRSSSRVSAQDPSEDLRRINTLSEFAQDPFSNPGCTTLLHDKSSESLSKDPPVLKKLDGVQHEHRIEEESRLMHCNSAPQKLRKRGVPPYHATNRWRCKR